MSDGGDEQGPACPGPIEVPLDTKDTSGFSELELLDITYDACNTISTGEVLASTIMQYLQTMTGHSAEQGKLSALQRLLDPECQDPVVSRENFHSTMREWIAHCGQEGTEVDENHVSWPDPSKVSINGLDYSSVQSKALLPERDHSFCEAKDLLGTIAQLKHTQQKLSEQNSSLLRTVAQCEDANLQLNMEITELCTKLANAQRASVRALSLAEELEDTRRSLREAQERASRTQSSCTKLSNEVECLRVHNRILEDKDEKLTFEKTYLEDSVNKVRKVNSELKAELEETLVMLSLKDREITMREILMTKMKNSHVESYNITEGLQSELTRLQEHSKQVLLRFDWPFLSLQNFQCRGDPPNLRSLHTEFQDMQQQRRGSLEDLRVPSLHIQRDGIQSIIQRIKSAELTHRLHTNHPDRDLFASTEPQERPYSQSLQHQTSIKQQLVNVLRDLELLKSVWEEKGEKVEEQRRVPVPEPEQRQIKTESPAQTQAQNPEARKVAVVNWWKALKGEGAKIQTKDEDGQQSSQLLSQTEDKLRQAEQTISDMKEKVCSLQATLKTEQDHVIEYKALQAKAAVLHTDKETNTVGEGPQQLGEKVAKDLKDAAVSTDFTDYSTGGHYSRDEKEGAERCLSTDGLLSTLRRMEAMVSGALETAELVRQSEQRVSRVKERMETITHRVEEALGRTEDTEQQLGILQARIMDKDHTESPGPIASTGLVSDTDESTADPRHENEDQQFTVPAPVFPQVTELPLRNGGQGHGGSIQPQEEAVHSPQGSAAESTVDNSEGFRGEAPFIFPHTRSRPSSLPSMPTLPEEEEDSPEEVDSSSSSPSTYTAGGGQAVVMTAPTIVFPQQATIMQHEGRPLEQARPHSPRSRVARNSSSGAAITIVDSTGNVIDLVKDQLPELQLSEEDRQKNLELLEQAKKVSDRFLTRRGRRSTSSLTESPTGLTPSQTPTSSPVPSRSSSISTAPQVSGPAEVTYVSPQPASPGPADATAQQQEIPRLLADWKPTEKRKVSSGTLTPRFAAQKENCNPFIQKKSPGPSALNKADEASVPARNPTQALATGVAKPVPRPPTQQAPCTAEIKTIGAFPPLMRAVSWDAVGSLNNRAGAPNFPPLTEEVFSFPEKPGDSLPKSSGYKDFPAKPVSTQKLSKLREEHKLMRNQNIMGSRLQDLSETTEQDKGSLPSPSPSSSSSSSSSSPSPSSPKGEEQKEKPHAMPNISDVMLRKLKLHRGLPGCAPPLSEKEVENVFVQLSLAFRNDNYTLETRLKQAERERNLTEENTEKELEEFKGALKMTAPQWQNMEQRESYQRLVETLSVLHRLATRLSSRAEIVGAVRQEKRLNKATEVMMQYVENLKRTYEKDHAELMEFKKLANQNSNRCYGGSTDTGDDGVARPSRSMSLTLGKALPRRRVSVAVVPKFNLLNIPGQTPATAGPGPTPASGPPSGPGSGPAPGATLPVLSDANDLKSNTATEAAQPQKECGKSAAEPVAAPAAPAAPAKPPVNLEEIRAEIRAEIKAKIEEEAYNKGYQEGLKQSKELNEAKEERQKAEEKLLESGNKDEESGKRMKTSSKMEEVLVFLDRYCPKLPWRRRPVWIVLTLCLIIFLVVNFFTYVNGYASSHGDSSAEKAGLQGKKKLFGLNVAAQPKNPTTE